MHEAHDPYAVLRIRDYRFFLAGGVLSSIGGEIQAATVFWEIYKRTGDDPAAIAYAGLTLFLPVLLFSLMAGHTADVFSRKLQFLAAQSLMLLSCVGLAVVAWLQAPVDLVYVCLFFSGMSRAFSAPARGSMLPQIIPMGLIQSAVTWSTSGFQMAMVGGPALGGFIYYLTGAASPGYVLSALCSALCMLSFVPIRPAPVARPAEPPSLASLFDGVRFVWRTKLLLAAITLDLFAVLLGGATALMAPFADILQVGPGGAGLLRAAPAVGALIMGLFGTHWPIVQRHSGPALLIAVAGFGAATIGFGLSTNFYLSLFMLALTGALDNISVVVRHTLVQVITPDSMRGRVSAVNLVFISSSNELGAFESGITAKWFGAVWSVVGGGIGTILVVLISMTLWPELMKLGSLHKDLGKGMRDKELETDDSKVDTAAASPSNFKSS